MHTHTGTCPSVLLIENSRRLIINPIGLPSLSGCCVCVTERERGREEGGGSEAEDVGLEGGG